MKRVLIGLLVGFVLGNAVSAFAAGRMWMTISQLLGSYSGADSSSGPNFLAYGFVMGVSDTVAFISEVNRQYGPEKTTTVLEEYDACFERHRHSGFTDFADWVIATLRNDNTAGANGIAAGGIIVDACNGQ